MTEIELVRWIVACVAVLILVRVFAFTLVEKERRR